MNISSITIGKRHRFDLGDLSSLAESIKAVGLLHPIVVDKQGVLIAGERRLKACELLGWSEIPVTTIDIPRIIDGEFAENAERKDFLPSEIDAIRRAMEPAEKAAARERMSEGGKGWKVSTPSEPSKTRDKLGAFAGVSGRTVEKIAAVVAAAEREPEKFSHLVDEMDRTGKANGAFRKIRQAQDQERVKSLVVSPGRYRALVIDPPWAYEISLAGRAAPGYATMSQEQLLALPVESWAEDNCHLYLWTTNSFITCAAELMKAWGFAHKTVLTWVKPKWGLGAYFRNQSEHVLFGIRGELATRSDAISTVFEAPMGGHSEKPEKFYEIVRAASYEPFGEAFQRTDRKDFKNVYRVCGDEE